MPLQQATHSQNHLALDKDRYQINKLICVNSMKNICYLELDVSKNTVLYGENNLGKTSILSTLKLHLLPEVNFRDSKNKFAFMGSSGKAFNNQESRDFYFPSVNSFLILEGQNPFGPYVTILFRASEEQFGYSRLVLPVNYQQIEHEFWDKSSPVNNHLGTINPQLSLKRVKSLAKEYNGRLLRSNQEIRESIYTFNQLNEEKGRFCIIPMKEGGTTREIEAFRRLLQFTFEINQGSPASLTNALATIIEGQKKSKKDELDQNLHSIIEEYNELNAEQEKITLLKNTGDYYQRIKKSFDASQNSLVQASEQYWQLKQGLLSEQQQLEQQESQLFPEYQQLNEELLPEHNKICQQLKQQKQQIKSQHDQLLGKLKHDEKEVARIKYLLNEEFAWVEDQAEIEVLLKEAEEELVTEVQSLQDEQSFATNLQDKIIQKNQLKAKIDTVNTHLQNSENALLYQVKPEAASVLKTINPSFDAISFNAQQADELNKINDFCALFEQKDQHLLFLQQEFSHSVVNFDPKQQRLEWEKDKQRLEKQFKSLDRQIEEGSQQIHHLTKERLQQQKSEKEKELTQTRHDLSLMISRDKTNNDYQQQSRELESLADQLKQVARELDDCEELLQHYQGKKQQLKQQIDQLQQQKQVFVRINKSMQRHLEYEKQFIKADKTRVNKTLSTINIDDEVMAEFEQLISAFKFSLEQAERTIHDLIVKEKLPMLDTEIVYRLGKTAAEIQPLVEQLAAEYENIASYEKHLQVLVRKHNKIVATKVSELEQNYQLINDFRQKLNRSFAHIKISDLEQIQVKLKLDPRFDELLTDIKSQNIDFYNDSLISADFYEKLNTFCGQFFTSRNGQAESLTLEGLIKEVLYEYQLKGLEQRTTSSQSNGTNAIINSTFLTILLNELIQSNIILSLPVVFDEIANLDYQNMQSVVEVVKSNHFSLFSATPTENLQLNHVLGNFINLDLFKAIEHSYDKQREIIYYGGAESIISIAE